MQSLLAPIHAFLGCETPHTWVAEAVKPENLPVVLLDHLVCELKAAQSAMFLIRRYAVDKESGDALLAWLKPFEDFTYRKVGDWKALANHEYEYRLRVGNYRVLFNVIDGQTRIVMIEEVRKRDERTY